MTTSSSAQPSSTLRSSVLHSGASTAFDWVNPWFVSSDHQSLGQGLDPFALVPILDYRAGCRWVLDGAFWMIHNKCACGLALFCRRWLRWIQGLRSSVLILCNRGHWVNLFSRSVGWAPALRQVFHRYRLESWGLVLWTLDLGGSADCSLWRWLAFGFARMVNSRRSVALDLIHDFFCCFCGLVTCVPLSFSFHRCCCSHCACSDVTWIWNALHCHVGLCFSNGWSFYRFFHFLLDNDYLHHLEEKWPNSGLWNQ